MQNIAAIAADLNVSPDLVKAIVHELCSRAGRVGAARMTPQERSERSRRAMAIRWGRVRARKAAEAAGKAGAG